MKYPTPERIGNVDLWTAQLSLNPSSTLESTQGIVTDCVTQTGISVVGYFMEEPGSLTLLHWPENREGYKNTDIDDCEVALAALAKTLQARDTQQGIVPADTLHIMMGRRMGGYDTAKIAPFDTFTKYLPAGSVQPAHMVSARVRHNAPVEPYGEPVGIITVPPQHEDAIHEVGHKLQQYHYAIERGDTGRTDFYETEWAKQ